MKERDRLHVGPFRARVAGAAVLTVALAAGVGCALVAGIDDYSPAVDAAAPVADAVVDARVAVDAGGGSDGPASADSGSRPPDANGPDASFVALWSFEDDFDEDAGTSHWTGFVNSSDGVSLANPGIYGSGGYSGCCFLIVASSGGSAGESDVYESWAGAAPPLTQGTFALRARFGVNNFALDPGGQQDPITAFVALAGAADDNILYLGQLTSSGSADPPGGNTVWTVSADPDLTMGVTSPDTMPASDPAGNVTWNCIELVVNVDQGFSQVSLYVDGASLPGASATLETKAAWTLFHLGLVQVSGQGGAEAFYDDVVAGLYADQSPAPHIGCHDGGGG